jgi:hypothetical protein
LNRQVVSVLNDVACNNGIDFQRNSHLLRITLISLEAEDCGAGHDAECGHLRKVIDHPFGNAVY